MRKALLSGHHLAVCVVAVPALVAGCVALENSAPELSNQQRTGSFVPQQQHPALPHDDPPSTVRLDRDGWTATQFDVPQRDVSHLPIYRSRPVRLTTSSPYQRGDYPTHDNAGQMLTPGSEDALVEEALWAPLIAAGEIFLMVPRVVLMPPGTPVRGPTTPIERLPGRDSAPPLLPPRPFDLAPSSKPANPPVGAVQ